VRCHRIDVATFWRLNRSGRNLRNLIVTLEELNAMTSAACCVVKSTDVPISAQIGSSVA